MIKIQWKITMRMMCCFFVGGNFCAGYDLSEVAAAASAGSLPDADTLPKGRGPMVR